MRLIDLSFVKKCSILFTLSLKTKRVSIYSFLSVILVLFKVFVVVRENKACFSSLQSKSKKQLRFQSTYCSPPFSKSLLLYTAMKVRKYLTCFVLFFLLFRIAFTLAR